MMHESDALRKEIEEQIKGKQQISVSLARSKADHAQLEEQYAMECEAKKEVQRQYDNSLRIVFESILIYSIYTNIVYGNFSSNNQKVRSETGNRNMKMMLSLRLQSLKTRKSDCQLD